MSFNNGANISEMTALWENLPLDRKADSFLKLLSQKEIVLPNIENGRWKFIDTSEYKDEILNPHEGKLCILDCDLGIAYYLSLDN